MASPNQVGAARSSRCSICKDRVLTYLRRTIEVPIEVECLVLWWTDSELTDCVGMTDFLDLSVDW
jgi:hypothetical protein